MAEKVAIIKIPSSENMHTSYCIVLSRKDCDMLKIPGYGGEKCSRLSSCRREHLTSNKMIPQNSIAYICNHESDPFVPLRVGILLH